MDGWTNRRIDTEGLNVIPCNNMAGYKQLENKKKNKKKKTNKKKKKKKPLAIDINFQL